MILTLIASFALFLSLAVLGFILARRLPELTIVTPEVLTNGRDVATKQKILEARFLRQVNSSGLVLKRILVTPVQEAQAQLSKFWHHFEDYLKTHRSFLLRRRSQKAFVVIRGHMVAAQAALAKDNLETAERELIEAVRINPRHAEAYALLGQIYLGRREYGHAREVWQLVEKLGGKSQESATRLAEIEMALSHPKQALAYYEQALTFSPRNPKLLDAAIEVALAAGDKIMARDLLERLRLVNPQNEKISDFEARLKI